MGTVNQITAADRPAIEQKLAQLNKAMADLEPELRKVDQVYRDLSVIYNELNENKQMCLKALQDLAIRERNPAHAQAQQQHGNVDYQRIGQVTETARRALGLPQPQQPAPDLSVQFPPNNPRPDRGAGLSSAMSLGPVKGPGFVQEIGKLAPMDGLTKQDQIQAAEILARNGVPGAMEALQNMPVDNAVRGIAGTALSGLQAVQAANENHPRR